MIRPIQGDSALVKSSGFQIRLHAKCMKHDRPLIIQHTFLMPRKSEKNMSLRTLKAILSSQSVPSLTVTNDNLTGTVLGGPLDGLTGLE